MMARVLMLTSPLMHGSDVTHLQNLLNKNAFDKDYLQGTNADGEFGPYTAQAVYRAEYWLGYAKPVQRSGTPLLAYLSGSKPLTAAMRDRRKARIARAQAAQPMRVKAFKEALTHVGLKESPAGSNRNPFGKWYGMDGVAWCAEFVSYCYAAAGSKQVAKGRRWAYTPYMVYAARSGTYGMAVTRQPKQGDIVLYDWNNDGTADHVELFDKWIQEGSTFASVGGNTSPTNASAGGQVYHYGVNGANPRSVNDVIVFAHLSS